MINIISEDAQLNPQLRQFPSSNATIAIFGTQSSGKSTFLNAVFNTAFPVLDTKKDRKRCTRGVWFQNNGDYNIIDTQGFDSVQRKAQQKIYQKEVALFCLAIADVVVINLWMNQVGRYQGSHSHILRSIIKVSQRLISSQQKKIIFVIKDCTEDADRAILKEQLSFNVNSIVKQQTKKNSVKLNIQYYFMSHYFYQRKQYQKQAKQFKSVIKVRKSHLSNYSPEDRVIYIKDLWTKITSAQNQVDLKSVEDALRNYTLERVKRQTLAQSQQLIKSITNLDRHKNFERYQQYIKKNGEQLVNSKKPAHINQKQLKAYTLQVLALLQFSILKNFTQVILPFQQDKLIKQLDDLLVKQQNSKQLQKVLIKKRKEVTDIYKKIINGNRESLALLKKFSEKINENVVKFERQISHLFNMFETKLQKQLNDQLDRQLAQSVIFFQGKAVDQKIKSVCKQFQYNQWQINFKDMWEKISHRCINQKLPQRIQQISSLYTTGASVFTSDRTANILGFHKKLQKDCEQFCKCVLTYFQEENIVYQPIDKIKQQIDVLLTKALQKQRKRFHVTLIIIGVFLLFFYGQFILFLSALPIKKKKRKYWANFYIFSICLVFAIVSYNKRNLIYSYWSRFQNR